MPRTLRSRSRIIEYFGAREVRVPCTTAETHSAPNLAFQNGTERGIQDIAPANVQMKYAQLG